MSFKVGDKIQIIGMEKVAKLFGLSVKDFKDTFLSNWKPYLDKQVIVNEVDRTKSYHFKVLDSDYSGIFPEDFFIPINIQLEFDFE